ncbi:MAG: NUDIX domain-containing protein [Polyangiales bacterium]
MAREAIPTWFFAMVVVRLGRRFLVVRERKHGQGWYVPAGRVEAGETLDAAAVRETLEESGVPVVIEGVLRVEHRAGEDGTARVRVWFVARPADDTPPKRTADVHSLEARWVTLEELDALTLRGDEVREVFRHASGGCAVYPMGVLAPEGAPW